MEPFLQKLSAGLDRLPVPDPSCGIAVAFSGGLDSAVLLAGLRRLVLDRPVRALHVDHGLHPHSADWERDCEAAARALGVAFCSARVTIHPGAGRSLEAAAREARYRALAGMAKPGELLLTAHHADDQLETVLLRLLRGSGVRGLRGITECGQLGAGYLGRPLLRISRREIRAVAEAWGLRWLEDPSNQDLRFDRNYLRAEILPRIKNRWPGAGATVGRTAQQMADAQAILEEIARADASAIDDPARVPQRRLLEIPVPRRRILLRHLIAQLGLPTPTARQLDTLLRAIAVERPDAQTRVQWPGGEGRMHGGCLYLLAPLGEGSGPDYQGRLSAEAPWTGPEGRVELCRAPPPGLPDAWVREGLTLRFRAGGERFRPLGAAYGRALKKTLQEASVLPWMRGRIPLLYRAGALVAVGDLWLSDAVREQGAGEGAWRIRWTDHPPLR